MSEEETIYAFPSSFAICPSGDVVEGKGGITLRDYFAAKAMQGLTAEGDVCGDCAEDVADRVAELSYIYADSMLKARDNK